jgi:hypothetical protein
MFATTAQAALGVCDAVPPDNVEVEATAGTPGPTSYNTLKAAFDAINAGTHQGSISIEVCGNTTETASAALNASGSGAAVYTAVSIKPVGGAARSVSGLVDGAPLIDFNGADNVTVDGVGTGGNSLTLSNTSVAVTAGTSTVRFIGGATGNTITHASVLGSSLVPLATAGGTIVFGTDTVAATGNDNNTISFCDIGPAGTNLPIKAIFGLGTTTSLANYNSGVVIDNNNVFDFFGTGAASVSGIHVLGGNDAWTISNNRLYQTAPRTFTATARYAGITLSSTTTGGAFTVSGNKIGFGASDGTGTTTISGGANEFRGIDATTTNITTPTVYQNNVVSGINQSTSDSGTTTSGPFIGITLGTSDGRYNAIGNQIVSLDGSSTIVINASTTTSSLIYGIFDFSFQGNTIADNTVGSITIQGTGTVTGFRGIYWNTGAALTETVTNNTVGSATGPIVDSQVCNNSMYGFNGVSAAAIMSGNTASYLSGNSTSAAAAIITVSGYVIGSTSTTVPTTFSRNTAHHLSNNAGASTNSGAIYGVSLTVPNTLANVVERNSVHTLNVTSTVLTYQLAGIVASQGTTTYRNNMVALGLDASGSPITTGYVIIGLFDTAGSAANSSQFYYNSVLIDGAGVAAGGSSSYALYSNVVTNTRAFENNILWNRRGNAAAGGNGHVALRIGATRAGLTSNYNDHYATGTDGLVGVFNATAYPTLANWQTATTQDAQSLSMDPLFVSATNLHVGAGSPVVGVGTAIAGITDDFDGDTRPASNPAIGADEPGPGHVTIAPASHDFGNQNVGSTSAPFSITLSNTGGSSFNVTAVTPAATPFAQSGGSCGAVPFSIAAGASCTLDYTFSPTAAGAANQSFTVTASAAGDPGFSLSGTGVAVTHTVTPSVGTPAGSISPNTPQVVNDGATQAFTLTPNAGFHIDTVTGTCPAGTLVGGNYTTGAITADCTVVANFAADIVTHTVTPSVGTPSGSISPSTPQTVNDGATTAFTLTADAGFHIDTVGGTCGGNLVGGTYTTNAVTTDCTVIANFAADGGGGTFPPDENFDEVTAPALPAGWVTSTTTGNDFTTVTTAFDTAPNAAFATDLPAVNDFTLDSPSFTPAGTTTLTFRHQFNLEDTFDGAVLEISINGGAFTDILAAGGSFGSGGYTDTISSNFSSPIAGRQAWSGSSGGFITTVAILPSAATGQPTKLRFRTADDSSVAPSSGPGWWVDSIHLSFATLPSVAKAFAPNTVQTNADSTLTITLTNPTTTAATLTGALVDTLPAGVVATASSASTTCAGGAGASNTSGSVTLATGAVIPANGTCVIAVDVHSASAGSYVNTIPVGALQTSIGNNDTAASATLTVNTPPVAVVTPNALSLNVVAGGTGSTPLNIANTGGSALSYTISEGSTSANARALQGKNYGTVTRAAEVMRAKYGPASLAHNPKAGMPPAMRRPVKPLGSTQISQMTDNSPGDEGVSCGAGSTSNTANSWWRRFYFNEHPSVGASTSVSAVTISSGSNGPNGVPVTINLYTIPHGTPVDTIPTASLTPIGTGTGSIDSGLVSVTIPVTGTVADTASNDLVVEFHIEAVATGRFFPGANATPETHPTFLSATDCAIDEPTTAATIGFPDFHLTMVVDLGGGTPPPTCANPTDIPWLSETPSGGSVAAGANTDVNVAADATSLAEGSYTANVCVGTNDPVTPLVTVPVTLTVGPAPVVFCSAGADEIFCDGFDPASAGPAVYTDRATFITHVAAGFYENDFSDLVESSAAEPARSYSSGGYGYTIDTTPTPDDLWFFTGVMTTNGSGDQIVVTFTAGSVTAVGGNFFASDIAGTPIPGNEVDLSLSDGTTETFTTTDENDYRGFTTAAPITSITIDAPNPSDPTDSSWSTMDNLLVGTAN